MHHVMFWSGRHPKSVIIFLLILVIFFSCYIPSIEVDVSSQVLWKKDDPAKAWYTDTLEKFGSDKITVIYVKDSALFTPDMLIRLNKFQQALEDFPNVERVDSLFTVTNLKGKDDGFLSTEPFLEKIPKTLDEAESIRTDALENPLAVNNLISPDGLAMTFNLFLDENISPENETRFSHQVDEIIATISPYVDQAFQFGTPYVTRILYEAQLRDQRRMLPLAVGLFTVASFLIWRSISLLGLTLITSGTSILCTMGFIGLCAIPMSGFTVIIPALLVVVGSTEDVHIFSDYLAGLRKTGNRPEAVAYMIRESNVALFLTALTTFLGFLAIALNDIIVLKRFGIISAFGLFINPFITFLVAPPYLKYFGPQHVNDNRNPLSQYVHKFFIRFSEKIVVLIRIYRWQVFCFIIGGTLVIGLFAFTIKVDNDFVGLFKPSSPVRTLSQQLHQELAGVETFSIHISSGTPDTFKKPENLAQIAKIQAFLRQSDWCDLTNSIVDYLILTNREMHDGDRSYERIPNSSNLIAQYYLIMPPNEIEPLIVSDASEVCIVVRHNVSSSHNLKKILAQLDEFISQHLNPYFDYHITGESILTLTAADTLASGQALSLSFTLVVVFSLMCLLFVNIKAGVLVLISNLLPLILLYGTMGLFGIALNTATSMVGVITVGIAVDDTIHFMAQYYQKMRHIQNRNQVIEACLLHEIRPITATTIGLILGMGVALTSELQPMLYFGFLTISGMVFALIADLCVTPILLSFTQLVTLWDMLTLHLQETVVKNSPLFYKLKHWQIRKLVLSSRLLRARQGEFVIQYGEEGHSMYLLLEGRMHVEIENDQTEKSKVIRLLAPGEIFGEIALIEPGPRSATIQAIEDVTYLEFDWDSIEHIRRFYPRIAAHLYRNLAQILGGRLKDLTQKLVM